jgi:2',3'-cyclic-nucleotide 2'-phosphodiesterase (5'-nucleotidase family)
VALRQAWEYAKAVGRMSVQFDGAGHVVSCSGRVTLPIPKNSQIISNIVGTPIVTKHIVQVRK